MPKNWKEDLDVAGVAIREVPSPEGNNTIATEIGFKDEHGQFISMGAYIVDHGSAGANILIGNSNPSVGVFETDPTTGRIKVRQS